jgi:two-component system LytT family response regulator
MLCTLIIDDETHNRDTLAKLLSRHCPDARIVGNEADVAGGIEAIRELHPDLVLLDIHMNDGTGFDLLHAFTAIDFRVIFISAFDKNAIQAFKLSNIEYLLKPVSPDDLIGAISRVMKTEVKHFAVQLQALEKNLEVGRRRRSPALCGINSATSC